MGGQLELVLLKHNHPPSSLWEKLWLKQEFIFDLIKNDDFQKKNFNVKTKCLFPGFDNLGGLHV